jgi:hypothetical protein
MGVRLSSFGCATLLLGFAISACTGETIDRIVATVNGTVVLQSDWEDALRFEAFSSGRPLDALTPADQKLALDHLIDQELLREQWRAADSSQASPEQVARRVAEIRRQYPEADTEAGWRSQLERYGLSEESLRLRLALQLDLLSRVDSRLRPAVNIDARSIESYYNQELLPQLRQAGGHDVPLAEVTGKIKELLTQEKINQLLTAWLRDLRAGSDIHGEGLTAGSGGRSQ